MGVSDRDTNRDLSIYVAVKRLQSNPTSTQREAFEEEIKKMSCLNHPNVLLFLGVCYHEPAFIMMEYMKEGDLNQFLRQYSEIVPSPSTNSQMATSRMVCMATQIACGMKYIASQNSIHQDLATRNCFVGENFVIKVGDFGVGTNYRSHYYRIHGYALVPIRWMASECFYGMFSEKSDVWAFGITMWELFTLSKDVPYPDLTEEQVIEDAVKNEADRKLYPKPDACPQSVYEIMLQCWAFDSSKRASFQVLHEMLKKLLQYI